MSCWGGMEEEEEECEKGRLEGRKGLVRSAFDVARRRGVTKKERKARAGRAVMRSPNGRCREGAPEPG